jgi:4'-phosphopantetheinyl transferase
VIPVRWLLVRSEEVPADDDWLAPAELERLGRMPAAPRRADFRLGRWAAKRALASWLGLDDGGAETLRRLAILPAASGAPEALLDGSPAPVALSFSHRAGRAACALAPTGTALGCDLEWVEPRTAAFVADYFTAAERALIEATPETDRPLLANLIWSAKESALKALRTGLRLDTREVEVELGREDPAGGWSPLLVRRTATREPFHGWWRREEDHLVTLAARPAPALPLRF